MKPFWSLLLSVCVVAVMAAWALARHVNTARVEKAEAAVVAEARQTALKFADLVRSGDGYVIEGRDGRQVRVDDRAWVSRLATALEGATYTRREHLLMILHPEIRVLRGADQILSVSPGLLRQGQSDFMFGGASASLVQQLIQEKLPDAPTSGAGEAAGPRD